MLFVDAADWYLLSLKARNKSPETLRQRALALRQLADFGERTGRNRLADFTPALVRACMADTMGVRPNRPPNWKGGQSMAAAQAAAARGMSRDLAKEGVQIADMSVVKQPRIPERIQPRTEADDFQALEGALRRRLLRPRANRFLIAREAALLELLSNTGLRAAECSRLDVTDLDLEEGTVTVRQGKGFKPRELPIDDPDPLEHDGGAAIRALRDYLIYRQQRFGASRERALWLTREGRRLTPTQMRKALASLCFEAGLENRPPHAFRRGWFTENYRDDSRTLPTLVARMGWSESSTTMIRTYTRGVDLELARSVPLPLNSKRWRTGGTPSPPQRQSAVPLKREGPSAVGNLGRTSDARAVPTPPRRQNGPRRVSFTRGDFR